MTERLRFRITGVVQGVGFRPFVYGLASDLGLTGFVGNDDIGVFIEVQGAPETLHEFSTRLHSDAPVLAVIASIDVTSITRANDSAFAIVESRREGGTVTTIPPDSVVCAACWDDVQDPNNRRYRYPFTTCTHCGPRYTLITGIPYDRPQTTMATFDMCEDCTAEYTDATDRRFHAQPIACARCGPQLQFVQGKESYFGDDALAGTLGTLEAGGIVAIKGIGGYHLACDARNTAAVTKLRERKQRGKKPFAVMVADASVADSIVELNDDLLALLNSRAAPIVLCPAIDHTLRTSVAPDQSRIGVMVAYSPLHRLLFESHPDRVGQWKPDILVMTSGNLADEPLCISADEANDRLSHIADAYLHHDRGIHVACDDSVIAETGQPVRRSRGYTPMALQLPGVAPPLLAVGGELKTTLCLARGDQAWLSQHIGDTANLETLALLERTSQTLGALLRITPEVIVTDQHPGYLSRRWGIDYALTLGADVVHVQHHHAHLASLLAEHSWPAGEPVIGFTFDGTGFGTDGTIWGGEILFGDYSEVTRVGHLRPVYLPGGDAAIKRPARTALAHLHQAGVEVSDALAPIQAMDATERRVLAQMITTRSNCTPTTSMGRLFDAVSSMLDVCQNADYEGQAAIELEALAERAGPTNPEVGFTLTEEDGTLIADPAPLILHIVESLRSGVSAATLARAFHEEVAAMVEGAAHAIRARTQVTTVGLTGGVFANRTLAGLCQERLEASGFAVLGHRSVPPNDGGLALGQAAIAASKLGG